MTVDHVGRQGTRSARFCTAALGGEASAGAGIGDAAPHHASDADAGGQAAEIARVREENERLRIEWDIKRTVQHCGAPVRRRNGLVLFLAAGG